MPLKIYDAYAAPFRVWGPWVNIDPEWISGKLHLSISAESVTMMPGAFEGQVHYFPAGSNTAVLQSWLCPGATKIEVADSIQQMRVRFRAFVNGFAVRMTVDDHIVPLRGRGWLLERLSVPAGQEPAQVASREFGKHGVIT